jgi:hypothetical protein
MRSASGCLTCSVGEVCRDHRCALVRGVRYGGGQMDVTGMGELPVF